MRNEKFHPEFMQFDLKHIFDVLGEEKFEVFDKILDKQIEILHKNPIDNTAPLTKPTLCLYEYRKLKFHSKKPEKGDKSDMRLVYRFIEETNTLQFLAVGFRWSTPDTVYDIAEDRDNKEFIGL